MFIKANKQQQWGPTERTLNVHEPMSTYRGCVTTEQMVPPTSIQTCMYIFPAEIRV